jgi:hypothetical protein
MAELAEVGRSQRHTPRRIQPLSMIIKADAISTHFVI